MAGLGASSISFWCRRCTEQSRSPEVNHVAVRVTHDLEFDVTRSREIFLDVHVTVPERRERFRSRQLKGARKILGIGRDAHSLSAAAGGGLDDDGESDLDREPRVPRPHPRQGPVNRELIGTPTSCIARRAEALSPMTRICSAVGPMNVMLDAAQVSANSAFSARNP